MSNNNLDNLLEQTRPTLSPEEKAALLRVVEVQVAAPVVSPYFAFIHSRTKTMTSILVALALIVGTTGTVAASESAKPGDLLFPIERAAERVQLAFAGEAREAELRAQFANERLVELREIIAEEATESDDVTTASTSASTSASVTVRESGEVRIAEAIGVVLDYLADYEDVEARAHFLTELQTDVDKVKIAGRSKTTTNVQTDDGARIQITDDRIEVRDDGFRLRIKDDGEVRVQSSDSKSTEKENEVKAEKTTELHYSDDDEYDDELEYEDEDEYEDDHDEWEDEEDEWEDHDDDDEYEDDDDHRERRGNDDSDDSAAGIEKFEVRVEGLSAEVRVEYNGKKLEYDTVYTTKAALLAEVALRTGLTTAELETVLDLEVE